MQMVGQRFWVTFLPLCFDTWDFCDWKEMWQLSHVPGETGVNRQHGTPVQLLVADIPHPCLLSLKTDRKQRKRGGSLFDCRQAPEAPTEHCLENKNKLIHKVLTALRAAVLQIQMAQEQWLYNAHEFLQREKSVVFWPCLVFWLWHTAFLHKVSWRCMGGGVYCIVYFYANDMPINDELSLFSLDNLIII